MRRTLFIILFLGSAISALFTQEQGNATYYSPKLKGRRTTDGSKYHPDSLTCAHQTYPLGTYLIVRNPKNNQQVVVKVTDRGSFSKRFLIDLSYSAAKSLDMIRQGIANVEVSKLISLPDALSLIPIPKSYLNVEQQMTMAQNLLNKIFGEEQQKKQPQPQPQSR